MKTKVVIDGSTITVGQLKDLFRMIDDGTIGFQEMEYLLGVMTSSSVWVTAHQLEILFKKIKDNDIDFEKMKSFLEHPKGTRALTYPSYVRASKILGHDKVISVQTAYHLWGIPYSQEERHALDPIKYSEATLRKCAAENEKKLANWMLIYLTGMSLNEQRVSCNASFFYKNPWRVENEHIFKESCTPGYYLVNIQNVATLKKSYRFNKEIALKDKSHCPLKCNMFIELVINMMIKSSDKLLSNIFPYHSFVMMPNHNHLCIGNTNGLYMYEIGDAQNVHMYVYKKHDLQ